MRVAARVGMLVALWLLAWGELSIANVLSGLAVASALLLASPQGRSRSRRHRLSARGTAALAGYVLAQLAVANVVMARQILLRHPDPQPGVIAHHLAHPSEETVTVMTSIIALSPGTMTVDVDPGSTTIHVHFFRLLDPAQAHRTLQHLEALVVGAIGTPRPAPEGP